MSDSPETALRLADFLPYQLSIASNAVSNRIAEAYQKQFGLKIPEWRVMAVLGDRGAMTQRGLTEATVMDKVAVNRACKALEERGLLARAPNVEDGRSHHLALTTEGQAMHARIMPLARAIEQQLFGGLDGADREAFTRLLSRVREEAGKHDPATA
jgi:DNA-binding MarR family transcriptional regulator